MIISAIPTEWVNERVVASFFSGEQRREVGGSFTRLLNHADLLGPLSTGCGGVMLRYGRLISSRTSASTRLSPPAFACLTPLTQWTFVVHVSPITPHFAPVHAGSVSGRFPCGLRWRGETNIRWRVTAGGQNRHGCGGARRRRGGSRRGQTMERLLVEEIVIAVHELCGVCGLFGSIEGARPQLFGESTEPCISLAWMSSSCTSPTTTHASRIARE